MSPKVADNLAADRHGQQSLGVGEGDGGGQPVGLAERFGWPAATFRTGNGGRLVGLGRGRGSGRLVLFEAGDQVAQAGRLLGEGGGTLLLVGERLGGGVARRAFLIKKK